MARYPVSPYWSTNPSIPIYLDPSPEEEEAPKPPPKEPSTVEHICPTCETSSRDQPIHCISVSPAPPSYSSVTNTTQSPRNLAVPVLNIQTTQGWSQPQPPRRVLQFDPEGRPQVRFRRNAFSPISPRNTVCTEIDWDAKAPLGLGIAETPFRPDVSPVTPGTVENRVGDREDALPPPSNLAERIEQRLWKLGASRNVIKRWIIEIISWTFSAACMAGIGIVLLVYQNKRNPNLPLGITLNAYISIMAKFASAGLLLPVSEALGQLKWSWFNKKNSKKMWDFEIFDSASRGPWGSLLLLVRTKGRTLAALGAAVTIFALALDPFFQQVADFPEDWRLQPPPALGNISSAITYHSLESGMEFRATTKDQLKPDPNIVSIMTDFFFGNGTGPQPLGEGVIPEIPLSCPNSKCEWEDYETLAVCSKCESVLDLLEFKCLKKELDWVQYPWQDEELGEVLYPNGTSCGWWLMADEPILMTGYNIDPPSVVGNLSGETLLMRAQPVAHVMDRTPLAGYPAKLNNIRNPLLHGIIVSGQSLENVRQNGTPIAQECVLSWCVKKMSSVYLDGAYMETVNETYVNDTAGAYPWWTNRVFDEDGDFLGVMYEYIEPVIIESPTRPYKITNDTHLLFFAVFDDAFPSTYSFNTSDVSDGLRFKQYITEDPWMRRMDAGKLPFGAPNITGRFEDMAIALTNAVRSQTGNSTTMISGPSYEMESFVQVRWLWLLLPFALLALTFFFLVGTIVRSFLEQDNIGVYKTSAIATLLFGLPEDMQQKIIASNANGTPRANAKETKVKWVPKAGWRFSGNTVSPSSAKARDSPPTQWD